MRGSSNLRLRLVVRRHALPEVRVVFAVQLDDDPTIANLLEQVNDIIPLESNDWGLEDYAVELRDANLHGSECLHFQQVSVILKNDEEVVIRPLDTGDRRKRRLGGRHQISTDGKHLIDGVAFGRPRLRTPRDRPPVDIPPLKRRRITHEADEPEDEEPRLLLTEHGEQGRAGRRVRIRATFDDIDDKVLRADEDEDDDFIDEDGGDSDWDNGDVELGTDGPDHSDLEDELRDLQADNDRSQDEAAPGSEDTDRAAQPYARKGGKCLGLEALDKISALRAAFPTVPVDVCERTLVLHGGSVTSAYFRLQTQHQPLMPLDAVRACANLAPPETTARIDGHHDSGDSDTESVGSVVKHYDQHGFPSGSILAGTASAQMVQTMRESGHPVKPPVHTKFGEDLQPHTEQSRLSASSAEGDDVSHSASGCESDVDDDNGSDSGPEVASSRQSKPPGGAKLSDAGLVPVESQGEGAGGECGSPDGAETNSDSEDSDGDDSSDSDSDGGVSDRADDDSSASDSSDTNSDRETDTKDARDGSGGGGKSEEQDSSSDEDSSDCNADDAPKSRPHRGKINDKLRWSALQAKSDQRLEPEALARPAEGGLKEAAGPVPPGQGKTATQRRNARRRAARKAQQAAAASEWQLSTESHGGTESVNITAASIAAKKTALLQSLHMLQEEPSHHAGGATSKVKDAKTVASQEVLPDNSITGTVSTSALGPVDAGRQAANRDPEAWRDKIIYRAVECCHDGVELSEPPFPFVQRWDPQQQYLHGDRNTRGGRSKRKQRDQAAFLDERGWSSAKRRRYTQDSQWYEAEDDNGESYANHDESTGFEDAVLNYDDEPDEAAQQSERVPNHTLGDDEDLPPLPMDVSVLPVLRPGEARPGLILTWKQWLLSKATNWQPQVSALTGAVVHVLDENTLRIRLAKRDRNLDHNEKVYDEEGNRVYDKFELPVLDDEAEEEAAEQGYRTLELADMIEPRVLRPAPPAAEETWAAQHADSRPNGIASDAVQQKKPDPPSGKVSATPGQVGSVTEARRGVGGEMDIDTQCGAAQSIICDTPVAQEAVDASSSEDQRHESSLPIESAGFRKDVNPSPTDNACLDPSNPIATSGGDGRRRPRRTLRGLASTQPRWSGAGSAAIVQ